MVKKLLRYITPLLLLAYTMLVYAIVLMIQYDKRDPGDWSMVLAVIMFLIYLFILFLNYIVGFINNRVLWWVMQCTLSVALVWYFMYAAYWK